MNNKPISEKLRIILVDKLMLNIFINPFYPSVIDTLKNCILVNILDMTVDPRHKLFFLKGFDDN